MIRNSRCTIVCALILVVMVLGVRHVEAQTGTSSNFQLVGQNPLFGRGMNAAPAIFNHLLYVGNRSDGSSRCGVGDPRRTDPNFGLDSCIHPHPGILILDIEDPTSPTVVGEIPAPLNAATPPAPVGVTSRELRVWPQHKLLITMNFRCSSVIHACPPGNDTIFPFDIKFFDLGDPAHPRFLSDLVPTSAAGLKVKPHEMFLWVDPNNGDRALLFISTPTLFTDSSVPNLMVLDISQVPNGGPVPEIAEGNWNNKYPGAVDGINPSNFSTLPAAQRTAFLNFLNDYNFNLFVHSMGVSADGTRTFLALEAGHFLVLDTSAVARNASPGQVISLNDRLLTDPTNRPIWLQTPNSPTAVPNPCTNPHGANASACPNSHSAVKVPSRHFALTTDEIYGTFTDPTFGCPWGWARVIDIFDPTHPAIVGEFLIDQDQHSFCGGAADTAVSEQFRSFSSHNPTVLQDLALIDWHSGGVQAIDIADPTNPSQAGFFKPTPLKVVGNEDPALSGGPATTVDQLNNPDVNDPDFQSKVVMWSYPIIKNGLIYVVDVRNGLYILKYTGPHAQEVQGIEFLEGNSNLGNAVDLDQNQQ